MSAPFFVPMLTIHSGCKINLFLNVIRRRDDGFHELETLIQPLPLYDQLSFERSEVPGIRLRCSHAEVPTSSDNLIVRAVSRFYQELGEAAGIDVHLDKRLPVAAGVGGGSGNAAAALRAMNELHEHPLAAPDLLGLAAELGSDVPCFLHNGPSLATGRGELVESLSDFALLAEAAVVLINPGFGVPTPWAYQNLRLDEEGGRSGLSAGGLIEQLRSDDWDGFLAGLFNSLEQPVIKKFPVIRLIRDGLVAAGADAAMMSGSGATVFGLVRDRSLAAGVLERFLDGYGSQCWSQIVPMSGQPAASGE